MGKENGKVKMKKIGRTHASVVKHIERIRAGPKAVSKQEGSSKSVHQPKTAPTVVNEARAHNLTVVRKPTALKSKILVCNTPSRPIIIEKTSDKRSEDLRVSKSSNNHQKVGESSGDLPAVPVSSSTPTTLSLNNTIKWDRNGAAFPGTSHLEDYDHLICNPDGFVRVSSLVGGSPRPLGDDNDKSNTQDKRTRLSTQENYVSYNLLKDVSASSRSSDRSSEHVSTKVSGITIECSTNVSTGDIGEQARLREMLWHLALRFSRSLNDKDMLCRRNRILVASRKGDFARLLDYAEVNKSLSVEYDEMKTAFFQQLGLKNTEITQLKAKIQNLVEEKKTISEKVNVFAKSKKEEVKFLNEGRERKERSLNKKHEEELELLRQKNQKAMQKLAHDAETNRQSSNKDIESKDLQIKALEAEIRENADTHETEISRLAGENYSLRNTVDMMQQCLDFKVPNMDQVKMILDQLEGLNENLKTARQKAMRLQNDNEDLLDSANITKHHVSNLYKKWTEGVAKVASLCSIVAERDETILQKDDLISTMNNLVAEMEFVSRSSKSHDNSIMSLSTQQRKDRFELLKKDVNIVSKEHWKMQELRRDLIAKQTIIQQMKKEADKVENDAFATEMEMNSMLAAKNRAKEGQKFAETEIEELEKQVQLLELALDKEGKLEASDRQTLLDHLHQQSAQAKGLREGMVNLAKRYDALLTQRDDDIKTLENDKMQAEKALDQMTERYTTETLYDQQRLHERIAALMDKMGESYYAESSHPFNKISADRNAMRLQARCITSRDGVSQIEPEVFDDDYWPGAIPATIEALRKLRPLGWHAVWEMDRCWLTPIVKPFTEEDAIERIQAMNERERMEHRAALGFEVADNDEKQVYDEEQERLAEIELIAELSVELDTRSVENEYCSTVKRE